MDLDALRSLAAAAEAADGAAPLDEATWLALRHHPGRVRAEVEPEGFALLVEEALSLVVAPGSRRRGLGGELLSRVLPGVAADRPLSAWSHGDHPGAARLAQRHGFARARELWVLRRAADDPLPEGPGAEGVTLRGYRPADADEVVRVNAAAFAHHPEQGAMDRAGLAERMAEPWFDPAGLIVADTGEGLLGFHWTKQHTPALGEVYVVGVDPAAQGRGLGRLLTLAGLQHLVGLGVEQVHLYVESDNAPAVRLYRGLGFDHAPGDTHVQYLREYPQAVTDRAPDR